MKILFYTDYYKTSSGHARIISDLLPYLEKGNEIAFVALGYNGLPVERKYLTYPTKLKGVKSFWAPEIVQYALRDFRPDIVLSSNDFYMTKKVAFAMSQPLGHKWIHWGTLDGDPLDYSCRESLKWVDYTLFFSDFAEREVRKVFPNIPGERLYPPINSKTFKKLNKEELRKQFRLHDKKVLVTCGRNQQRKNIPILLDAMVDIVKKMPETRLILASTNLTKTAEGKEDGYEYNRFITDRGLDDFVINLGQDIKKPISDKLLNIQYNLSDLMVHPSTAEGFCCLRGTKIFTKTGFKNIEDVTGDNSILGQSGEWEKCRPLSRKYSGRVYKIHPHYMKLLSVTKGHPVAVYNHLDKIVSFKNAEDVTSGDIMVMPKIKPNTKPLKFILNPHMSFIGRNQFGAKFPHPSVKMLPKRMAVDDLFLKICGYFVADGVTSKKGSSHFCINDTTKIKMVDDIEEFAQRYGLNSRRYLTTRHRLQVIIDSIVLSRLLNDWFGHGAQNKKLPNWIYLLNEAQMRVFVGACWSGDGSKEKHNAQTRLRYSTTSETLASQIFLLTSAITDGVVGIRSKRRKKYNNTEWTMEYSTLPMSVYGWSDDRNMYMTIRSIETTNIVNETVYNLTTETTHTYATEGGLVHNCLPIAEAGLCEVPTLGVDHSAVTEVIGSGGNVIPWRAYAYVMNGIRYHLCHPDDITKAVIDAFKRPEELKTMGKNARRFAETLSPKIQAEKMLEIFNKVLKDDTKSLIKQGLNL